MKQSIIRDLQQAIVENVESPTQLLRETKLIAAKLELEDIERWVDYELNGYPPQVDPPPYRKYTASQLEVRNPVRGWGFAGHVHHTMKARQPIDEVERLSRGGTLTMPLRENLPVRDATGSSFGSDWPQRIIIDSGQFKRIIEAVTNELLQWTIELEKRGITGDGIEFHDSDRRSAARQVFNIQKFIGVLGDVTNSQVTLYDYSSILPLLKERNVPQSERNELENIMDDLKTALPEKKRPLVKRGKAWVTRNKDFLGATAEIILKAIGASIQ